MNNLKFIMGICILLLLNTFEVKAKSNITYKLGQLQKTVKSDSFEAYLTLYNQTSRTILISDIISSDTEYTIANYKSGSMLSLKDSLNVRIALISPQNITHYGSIIIRTSAFDGNQIIPLTFKTTHQDTFYKSTDDLWDGALKAQLRKLCSTHTSLGYTKARDKMYGDIFVEKDDSITCVYTGRRAKFKTRADATANNFNCEHTFPQSMFSSADPMLSDIYHLYPVDEKSNTQRSDNPFGVVTTPKWSVGGSKWSSGVFEPRDKQKGDGARSLLYLVLMYQDFKSFIKPQESILRKWVSFDPVDSFEKVKATKIQGYQGNRNPLIDFPLFLDRIYSVCTSDLRPKDFTWQIPFKVFNFDSSSYLNNGGKIADSIKLFVPIVNKGNQKLKIKSITPSDQSFFTKNNIQITIADSNLNPNSSANIYITGQIPLTLNKTISQFIKVLTTDSIQKIDSFSLNFKTQLTNVEQIEMNPSLLEVYPNPANESIIIKTNIVQIKSIQIVDYVGQSNFYTTNHFGSTIIPIGQFSPGLLIIKTNLVDGNVLIKKIIKE